MILLIVSDDEAPGYVRYLTTAGFRAASVPRVPAAEIIDRTLAATPDMIVIDSDRDGETVDRLKADRRTAPIPILVLAEFLVPAGRLGLSEPVVRDDIRM